MQITSGIKYRLHPLFTANALKDEIALGTTSTRSGPSRKGSLPVLTDIAKRYPNP